MRYNVYDGDKLVGQDYQLANGVWQHKWYDSRKAEFERGASGGRCAGVGAENWRYEYIKEGKGKIYIAGKISGLDHSKAKDKFAKTEKMLQEQGYDVVNPMALLHRHDKSWSSYMRECLRHLVDCDTIYLQKDWIGSKGAIAEGDLAQTLGLNIIYE